MDCDILPWLGPDLWIKILTYLVDSPDLIRASAVSWAWREFVIANGFCKKLCLRMFPGLSNVTRVVEVIKMTEHEEVGSYNFLEGESPGRDHRLYALLAQGVTSFRIENCISNAISASSTDNYPEESIENTLVPNDQVEERPSYWSSEGESDPAIPETLTYKLISNLCVITEINIKPFKAYFQFGHPIYSAKAVRFRMGHLKPLEAWSEDFISTYVSPEFPMAQENCLQKFELPEPVLCIGGILQIELLGRVQRQEMDGLFYICVSNVQAVGRRLSPAFDIEILDCSGKCTLKYYPEAVYCMSHARSSKDEPGAPSCLCISTSRLMQRGEELEANHQRQ